MEQAVMHSFNHPSRTVHNIHLATCLIGLLSSLNAGYRPESDLLNQLKKLGDFDLRNRDFPFC